jgi:ankyrin repeat protein
MQDTDPQVLFSAIQAGDQAMVKELVGDHPALARVRNEQGISAILVALYYNQPEIARFLGRHVKPLDIFEAASLGDTRQAESLLAEDPDLANALNFDGFQPLGLAAFFGHNALAHLLLEHGAQVNSRSQNAMGAAPLHSALAARSNTLVKVFLEHGADVNLAESGGYTPLHIAAQNGDIEALKLLMDHHPDPNPRLEADGLTPLGTAVKYGNELAAAFLRQHGCKE